MACRNIQNPESRFVGPLGHQFPSGEFSKLRSGELGGPCRLKFLVVSPGLQGAPALSVHPGVEILGLEEARPIGESGTGKAVGGLPQAGVSSRRVPGAKLSQTEGGPRTPPKRDPRSCGLSAAVCGSGARSPELSRRHQNPGVRSRGFRKIELFDGRQPGTGTY